MTTNDTPTAENLIHKHLADYEVVPHFSETRVHKIHNLYADFPTIAESYLSLLDQLQIAKEALVDIAKWRESDGNIRRNIRQDIAIQALSKLTI